MMQNQNDNQGRNYYKELSIQVRLSGLSFCVYDPILNLYEKTDTFSWSTQNTLSQIENDIRNYISQNQYLNQLFSKVNVMHVNEWFTLVPKVFFSPNNLLEYLKYNVKVFPSDLPSYDQIEALQLYMVYLPYTQVNNLLLDYFPDFDYEHCASVFLKTILPHQLQHQQKSVYVHLEGKLFLMAVFDADKLLYYNQFECHSPEDYLYYLLFSARQLQLDFSTIVLYIMGETEKNKDVIVLIESYIKRVIQFEPLRYTQSIPQSYFLLTQMF